MTRFLRDNGLTVALVALFLVSLFGHVLTGHAFQNEQLASHNQPAISLLVYVADDQFLSTLFENWESEFLQMATYVVLTAYLFQRGSSESADPDKGPRDELMDPQDLSQRSPPLLRAGRTLRWIYAHSLGIVLALLFVVTFLAHWHFSAREAMAEARLHHEPPLAMIAYLSSAQLWFESFQNWQSEFLSTAVLVVLSIYLRQKGSPESKPVGASHFRTGE